MISASLLLMFVLVLARPNSFLKPSFLATLTGVLALSTWGFLGVSTASLDQLIGGANWITLVRDIFATLSFWFYREAVARAVDKRPLGSPRMDAKGIQRTPWLLFGLIGLYAVPFSVIADRGSTSSGFVMDRLDQPAVWLFASLYMAGLVFLSADALRLIRRPRGLLLVIAIGYVSVIVGCVVEIGYLTLAHLGVGGSQFRVSMYFAAELPFFAGILIIGAAIAWNAATSWLRYRGTLLQLMALARRHGLLSEGKLRAFRTLVAAHPRRIAFSILISIQNEIEASNLVLNQRDVRILDRARRRFLNVFVQKYGGQLGMVAPQ